jgi:ABC-2 type transport system permease protein
MAVELTMASMKLAVLRHSYRGRRGQTAGLGAALGGLLAAGTAFLGLGTAGGPEVLAAAYAVWMLGWIAGPVFMGGGDETLRPEYFSMLGLPRRRLAQGLFAAAFVGVSPLVSLVALLGLPIAGARLGVLNALVALPAAALQLAVFVLASRVVVAIVGLALRSRAGALGSGLVNGLILAALGQCWVFFVALGVSGIPPAVWYLPSSWGVLAVRGEWWALGALAGLVVLLLAAWAGLLGRRSGTTRVSGRDRRPMRAGTAAGAVVAKELRTSSRDLVRNHQLAFALAYGIGFGASPLLIGWDGMLPFCGPIFVVMAAAMAANAYGTDGTALWLTVLTPGASDVRGRQSAWLAVQGPIAVALTTGLTAVAGGPWPMVLALLAALLGGAAGLVPLISLCALVPGTDPHRRAGNPLRTSEDDGGLTGLAYLTLALVILTAVPAGIVAAASGWAGVAVGVVTGAACWWGFGRLAERRLAARGPELLETMRTGRKPPAVATVDRPEMGPLRQYICGLCFGLGAIPLIPQGILAAVFVANGMLRRSWFLATYLPGGWRYPVAGAFILLGLAMYGTGLGIFIAAGGMRRLRPARDR